MRVYSLLTQAFCLGTFLEGVGGPALRYSEFFGLSFQFFFLKCGSVFLKIPQFTQNSAEFIEKVENFL